MSFESLRQPRPPTERERNITRPCLEICTRSSSKRQPKPNRRKKRSFEGQTGRSMINELSDILNTAKPLDRPNPNVSSMLMYHAGRPATAIHTAPLPTSKSCAATFFPLCWPPHSASLTVPTPSRKRDCASADACSGFYIFKPMVIEGRVKRLQDQ